MAEIDLGPVEGPKGTSMRFRGDWNGIAEYRNDEMFVDCVAYDNGLWICKATCSAQMPADGSEYWSFACAGIAGPQGDKGDKGEPASLGDLGITASVEEINNSGGSTGNIQGQINILQEQMGAVMIDRGILSTSDTITSLQNGYYYGVDTIPSWLPVPQGVLVVPTPGTLAGACYICTIGNLNRGMYVYDARFAKWSRQGTGVVLLDTSRALDSASTINDAYGIGGFDFAMVTVSVNNKSHTMTCYANKQEGSYAATWGYGIDTTYVEWIIQFDTSGRYLTNAKAYRSMNRGAWQELTSAMNITRIVGYTFF